MIEHRLIIYLFQAIMVELGSIFVSESQNTVSITCGMILKSTFPRLRVCT